MGNWKIENAAALDSRRLTTAKSPPHHCSSGAGYQRLQLSAILSVVTVLAHDENGHCQ